MTIKAYQPEDRDKWERLIEQSVNGTVFQSMNFLGYHQGRFAEHERHIVWMKGDEMVAAMPLAIFDQQGSKIAKSPYGASYGGIVFREWPTLEKSKEMTDALIDLLKSWQVDQLSITPSLAAYSAQCDSTWLFTLFCKGMRHVNSDIVHMASLSEDMEASVSSSIRRFAKKARKYNVEVNFRASVADFWTVMMATFQKHGVSPTHTREEWEDLMERFPERVWCDVAYFEGTPVAGIGHVAINERIDGAFYICQDTEYNYLQASSLLFLESMKQSAKMGFEEYDFGTSSVQMQARDNIFAFKERFGTRGVFRHSYQLDLT